MYYITRIIPSFFCYIQLYITLNLEQMPIVESHTTCLNLYGMEVIVLLIVAVISTYDSVSMFIHARMQGY